MLHLLPTSQGDFNASECNHTFVLKLIESSFDTEGKRNTHTNSTVFCLERLSGAQGLSPTLVAQVVLIATVGCHAQGEILTRHAAPHSKPVLPLGSAEGMPARGASSTLRSLTQPRWGG